MTSDNGSSEEVHCSPASSSDHPAFQKKPIPQPLMDDNNHISRSTNAKSNRRTKKSRLYDAVDGSDNEDEDDHKHHSIHPQPDHHSAPSDNGEQHQEGTTNTNNTTIERHLSLVDLMAIGIGGTIGSGLFVLVGLVAHKYAGPATVLSWCVSGLAACLSGCAYAELSARIPLPGGAYAYSYVAIGEFPAILTATCLSMNYIASSAAVARSWGDKVEEWFVNEIGEEHWLHVVFKPYKSFSPFAFLISLSAILLLLNGVKESKRVTNFFTLLKALTALFMVITGFYYTNPLNWSPFLPAQFGVSGVMRGATGTVSIIVVGNTCFCFGMLSKFVRLTFSILFP
jgi:amino acid permease